MHFGGSQMSVSRIQGRIAEIQARFGGHTRQFADVLDTPPPSAPTLAETPVRARVAFGPLSPQAATLPTNPSEPGLGTMLARAAKRYQLDPALVKAVMTAESNGDPGATSPVGAMGLMQLMPGTARDLGVTDPYDPQQNLNGGTKYLAGLTKRFGLETGIAAYNAGPGAVDRHGGIPPYPETQHYVKKVLSLYHQYQEH